MPLPDIKIEIGFDLSDNPNAPLFQLDDPVKGRLDNTEYRLAGEQLYDVTEYVSAYRLDRGREPIDSNYDAAEAEVQFNNHGREFDPLYTASPFYPDIIPRRELRITANDEPVFRGWIEDWDLSYKKDGDSMAFAKGLDATNLLANRVVLPHTPSEELSGTRINAILDRSEVSWPADLRDIDSGAATIGANPLTEAFSVLEYLRTIAGSDPGEIFIDRRGRVAFRDRLQAATSADLVEFGGTGLPFDALEVQYGAELLFNEIVLTRQGGGTATVSDLASIGNYGVRTLSISDSQVSSDAQLVDIGLGLIELYSEPTYRFSGMDVYLHKLSEAEQTQVLALDFGSVCKVTFTPNNIGDPIERYVEVINIAHRVDVERFVVSLGFEEIAFTPLVLDDVVFGKLDEGVLSW